MASPEGLVRPARLAVRLRSPRLLANFGETSPQPSRRRGARVAREGGSRTTENVACRGSRSRSRAMRQRAIRWAPGPLKRTTPMPPRPGGVAMATMVSEVENMTHQPGITKTTKVFVSFVGFVVLLPFRDEDCLREGVADALRCRPGDLG